MVLEGPLNETVTKTVRSWNATYETKLVGNPKDFYYCIVDISEPKYLASFVVEENVNEVFDHRPGFEEYWKTKIGDAAKIYPVGCCATLIWEEYKTRGLDESINALSANLLYTAIISNTLNFSSQNTTHRDFKAFQELTRKSSIPMGWSETYFGEIAAAVLNDPIEALQNDTKTVNVKGVSYKIGQLELWKADKFVREKYNVLMEELEKSPESDRAFITIPSIQEGVNYIMCLDIEVQQKLTKAIGAVFNANYGKTPKLWLRKEIIRELGKIS